MIRVFHWFPSQSEANSMKGHQKIERKRKWKSGSIRSNCTGPVRFGCNRPFSSALAMLNVFQILRQSSVRHKSSAFCVTTSSANVFPSAERPIVTFSRRSKSTNFFLLKVGVPITSFQRDSHIKTGKWKTSQCLLLSSQANLVRQIKCFQNPSGKELADSVCKREARLGRRDFSNLFCPSQSSGPVRLRH